MASFAPAWLRLWAMAQAMLRLLATPNTTAFFPCMLSIDTYTSIAETGQDNRKRRQTPSASACGNPNTSIEMGVCRRYLLSCPVSAIEVYVSMLSMQGKNAVEFGVANKRSIAWAIAQSLSQAGAKLAITYMNERMKAEAYDLIASLPGAEPFQCDVSSDSEIEQLFAQLKQRYGRLDALAHSIPFAPPESIKDHFLNTTRQD